VTILPSCLTNTKFPLLRLKPDSMTLPSPEELHRSAGRCAVVVDTPMRPHHSGDRVHAAHVEVRRHPREV
jgi:hypothetical protein